jgi:hypothetical protein
MSPGTAQERGNLLRFTRDVLLVIAVVAVNAIALDISFGAHGYGDLGVFRDAGRAVLDGRSPYPPAVAVSFRNQDAFVYPAPAAVLMVPFALLPLPVAATIFLLIAYASLIGAVRLAGVTSWRFTALVLGSVMVLQALTLGTVTPLLTVACAAAWRYRDRRLVTAAAFAAAIVIKLYLAPLLLWLVITGRRASALASGVIVLLTVAIGWALIGFHGLRTYPDVLRMLVQVEGRRGFSTAALAQALGASPGVARAIAVTAAAALLAAAVLVARRARGDARAFVLVLVACLVASPIVWLDYQVLLIVPIALLAPRPSMLWALPLASWFYEHHNGVVPISRIVLAHVVLATLAFAAIAYRTPKAVTLPPGEAGVPDVVPRPRSPLA